jgi:hypothetical protein
MTGILQAIGESCGTDKADRLHAFAGETYLDVYERYLAPLRDEPIGLLEIGVNEGASLRMWKKYFSLADIYGIDINPECAKLKGEFKIAIGNQKDSEFLNTCFPGWSFDVIVDDGAHINTLTLLAFCGLWPRLNQGGLYIFEDMMCSYDRLQSEQNILKIWPGMKYNDPHGCYDNDRELMDNFFKSRIFSLDHLQGEIRFVHFWPMMVVIGKV